MADDIHRMSDELAREPSSLVFLELGEALRRYGELDVAIKIGLRGLDRHPTRADAHALVARIASDRHDFRRATQAWETVLRYVPDDTEAMKGLGYISFQEGRFEDAERFLGMAQAVGGAAPDPSSGAGLLLRPSVPISSAAVDAMIPADPARLFADMLVDDGQTALLLDANGYVLGGLYLDADGNDLAQEIGAQLSGISDEVVRACRHFEIGDWRSILFETQVAVVALAPAADQSLLVVAASRATPLGLLRRLLERCARRSAAWLDHSRGTGKAAAIRDEQ